MHWLKAYHQPLLVLTWSGTFSSSPSIFSSRSRANQSTCSTWAFRPFGTSFAALLSSHAYSLWCGGPSSTRGRCSTSSSSAAGWPASTSSSTWRASHVSCSRRYSCMKHGPFQCLMHHFGSRKSPTRTTIEVARAHLCSLLLPCSPCRPSCRSTLKWTQRTSLTKRRTSSQRCLSLPSWPYN